MDEHFIKKSIHKDPSALLMDNNERYTFEQILNLAKINVAKSITLPSGYSNKLEYYCLFKFFYNTAS